MKGGWGVHWKQLFVCENLIRRWKESSKEKIHISPRPMLIHHCFSSLGSELKCWWQPSPTWPSEALGRRRGRSCAVQCRESAPKCLRLNGCSLAHLPRVTAAPKVHSPLLLTPEPEIRVWGLRLSSVEASEKQHKIRKDPDQEVWKERALTLGTSQGLNTPNPLWLPFCMSVKNLGCINSIFCFIKQDLCA